MRSQKDIKNIVRYFPLCNKERSVFLYLCKYVHPVNLYIRGASDISEATGLSVKEIEFAIRNLVGDRYIVKQRLTKSHPIWLSVNFNKYVLLEEGYTVNGKEQVSMPEIIGLDNKELKAIRKKRIEYKKKLAVQMYKDGLPLPEGMDIRLSDY